MKECDARLIEGHLTQLLKIIVTLICLCDIVVVLSKLANAEHNIQDHESTNKNRTCTSHNCFSLRLVLLVIETYRMAKQIYALNKIMKRRLGFIWLVD